MSLLESAWLLLLLPLAVRYLGRERNGEEPWNTRIDVPLALACGVGVAALCGFWFARYHLKGWPLTASDFSHYCQSVASLQEGTLARWVPQRSVAAGWMAGMFSREIGVLGGLLASALVSMGVVGAAMYLWGRAAHGRVAGVASALLVCAVGPLVVLARTVTFYPPFIASCALCSAGAMLAVRYRTLPALFAGGLGAGIALVVDVRGLYWALAGLGVTLIGAVPQWLGHLPKRLFVVAAPVVASWFVARALILPHSVGLDGQTQAFVEDAVMRVPGQTVEIVSNRARDFLWGRSSPLDIPATLLRVTDMMSLVPGEVHDSIEVTHTRVTHLLPWLGPIVGALLLWGLRMRLRPWTMLAFLLTLVPYAAAYWSAATTLAHPRYLAVALLGAPAVLGVTFGAYVGAPVPVKVSVPTLGVLLVLVLGVVPSWLSPVAGWRKPFSAEMEPRTFQMQAVPMDVQNGPCLVALARDHYRDRRWAPYPYPSDLPELPNVTESGDVIFPTPVGVDGTPDGKPLPTSVAPAAPAGDAPAPATGGLAPATGGVAPPPVLPEGEAPGPNPPGPVAPPPGE